MQIIFFMFYRKSHETNFCWQHAIAIFCFNTFVSHGSNKITIFNLDISVWDRLAQHKHRLASTGSALFF